MMNYKRYQRVPVVNYPEREWPNKAQRAFTAFLLWAGEILQDFRKPKQALRTPHCLKLWGPRSKRFLIMSANFSFAAAKVQQNLRMCKFCVEKVLGV